MKKLLCFGLIVLTLLSLSACSNHSNEVTTTQSSDASDVSSDDFFDTELSRIPDDYMKAIDKSTPTVKVTYTHKEHTKSAIVYLPPNYDENNKYNILYILGGVHSDETAFFKGENKSSNLKNILDHMIINNDTEPCIVVNLAFYPEKNVTLGDISLTYMLEDFNEELREVIIPTIETKFSTYADSVNKEDLEASRKHRAFAGFSMGGAVCWNTLATDLDYFHYFAPMAAGSFEDYDNDFEDSIGSMLRKELNSAVYTKNDFFVFASEGTKDVTYDKMEILISRYKKEYSDVFIFTDNNKAQGNITYKIKKGAKHSYDNAYEYLYNSLCSFWP